MHEQRQDIKSAQKNLIRLELIYNEMADFARATATSLQSALDSPSATSLHQELQKVRLEHAQLEILRRESDFAADSLKHDMSYI